MKNLISRSFPVVLVALSLLAVISAMACSGGSGYGNAPATTSSVAAATGNSVTLASFAFSPATITVTVGTAVTWTNKDSTTHTITSDSGVFDSGNLAANGTYSYTFTKAGTYPYHCTIHTYMKGTVIVQ
jgi:plastocyanin